MAQPQNRCCEPEEFSPKKLMPGGTRLSFAGVGMGQAPAPHPKPNPQSAGHVPAERFIPICRSSAEPMIEVQCNQMLSPVGPMRVQQ
jgi:hypothetical protein